MVSYILSLILSAEAEIIKKLTSYKEYFIFGHTYVKRHAILTCNSPDKSFVSLQKNLSCNYQ